MLCARSMQKDNLAKPFRFPTQIFVLLYETFAANILRVILYFISRKLSLQQGPQRVER